ncbi:hypothetical protein [Desnuesiella massiliensis]|uniref:hypothetical protein n=1 Tax=Desnuesiella massiliensis TaxID=1650662 RepID=UPI0006E1AD4F|nr:hypothetical protein [Desnuesiella massiliensis]
MNKLIKAILTFIISLFVTYLIVGYIANNVFAHIRWDESATSLDKFREYYIRTFSVNIIPTLILAIIPTALIMRSNGKSA